MQREGLKVPGVEREILLFRSFQGSCESENSSVLMTCRLPALPVTPEGNGFRKKAEQIVSTWLFWLSCCQCL